MQQCNACPALTEMPLSEEYYGILSISDVVGQWVEQVQDFSFQLRQGNCSTHLGLLYFIRDISSRSTFTCATPISIVIECFFKNVYEISTFYNDI